MDDRRDSYRFTVDAGEARVDLPIRGSRATIRDLSGSGGSLLFEGAVPETIDDLPVVLQLGGFDPFQARLEVVHRAGSERGASRLGVRFEVGDRRAMASLSWFLVERLLREGREAGRILASRGLSMASVQRERVRRLLLYHGARRGQPLHLYGGADCRPLLLRVRGLTVEAARELIAAEIVSGRGEALAQGREYTFGLPGSNAISYFTSAVFRIDGRAVWITLPEDIRQTGHRSSLRVRPDVPVALALRHPRLAGVTLEKPVIEVSGRGLSFPLEPGQDLLYPGEPIQAIRIRLPEGEVRARAIVRSVDAEAASMTCGVELLQFPSPTERERWVRFVFGAIHPHLRLGDAAIIGDAWDTLCTSGYLEEVTPGLRDALSRKFAVSWRAHSRKTEVARYFMLYKGERPVGTLAANLVYPGTWLIHHLGIDEAERRDRRQLFGLAREMYAGNAFLLEHLAESDHFVIYVNAEKAWTEMMYGQFLRAYRGSGDYVYDDFRVYKRGCGPIPTALGATAAGLRVVDGDTRLLRGLAARLAQDLSQVEVEALAYSAEAISLAGFSADCAARGYERGRTIFFAMEGDEPLGALVAETGDEGLNIFSLFNRCWMFPLAPPERFGDAAREQLLCRAAQHYQDAGKQEFIFLAPPTDEPVQALERAGFEYVTDVLRWLARRCVLPAYLNYIEEFLGMLG